MKIFLLLALLAGCRRGDDKLAHVRLQVRCGQGEKEACDEVERRDREGCEQGNGHSCNLLGIGYEVGKFLPRDAVKAAEMHRRGCSFGDAPSCWYAGMMLHQGRGVARDESEAIAMFQKSCDGNHENGCLSLGDALGLTEPARALAAYERGCQLKYQSACERAAALRGK